ncbi:MAG: caspase family protein [Anaerolineales bacterium]|jgi:hypothetical protein
MPEQHQPIYIVLSPDIAEEFDVERLNQLTREFGRSLEGQPEFVQSISYAGREDLPKGTKTPELIFAQQVVLTLVPIVTPWILDKVDHFVKASQEAKARIEARLQIGTRQIQVTPKTSPAEITRIKQQIKSVEKLAPGKRHALVIGNAEYQDEHLAALASPTIDAQRLAESLSDPNIGAFDQVDVLINEDDQAIERSIERFFSNRDRDDLLLLYFSGHGLRNEAGQLFLAARNTTRELIRSTGVAASFIKEIMDASFSQRQILILDCCFGGAMLEGAKSEQIVGQPAHSTLAFQTAGFGRVIITASEAMQYAFDGQSVQGQTENSAFTSYLIEGLRSGSADTDQDGLVAIDELYQYAYRQVIPRQTPSISTTAQTGRLFIALNPNPTVRPGQLPADLNQAMRSENRVHRMGAASELARLLKTGDPAMVMAAEMALRQMTSDDSRAVSEAAQQALNQHFGLPSTKSQLESAPGTDIETPAPVSAPSPLVETPSASQVTPEMASTTAAEGIGDVDTQEIGVREAISAPAKEQEALPVVAGEWSWGAFWLTFIWGLKHKSWIPWLFLFPFPAPLPQLAVGIYCGIKGRRWAWQNLEWEGEEHFVRAQRKWSLWGFLLGWLVWAIVILFWVSITGI